MIQRAQLIQAFNTLLTPERFSDFGPNGLQVEGKAPSDFEASIAASAQAFITGEISEPQAHYARECGVAYLACGHHATERYGAPAVTAQVASQLGLVHEFIDINNPA